MLYDEPYKDPWYFAAEASNGSWSTLVYLILPSPKSSDDADNEQQTEELKTQGLKVEETQPVFEKPVEFYQENAKKFICSVTESFNKLIDKSTACDAGLKESVKQQFRDNCIEYLLRGVYAFYETPSPERDNLVDDILKYAGKMSDGSEPQPSE